MKKSDLAVATGASSGIGLDLARCRAQAGYDLVLAADDPALDDVAGELRTDGIDTNVTGTRGLIKVVLRPETCGPAPGTRSSTEEVPE